MRGYPKHLNTRQDIDNIQQNHPEFKEQLKQDLQCMLDEPETVEVATSLIDIRDESKGWNTKTVPNPSPRWKQLGFKSKDDVKNTMDKLRARVPHWQQAT